MTLVVGIGGTLRPNSTTEQLARAVLAECASRGADTKMFGGAELARMPHYNPYQVARNDGQRELVEAVRRCDALVIASPGYHGGVSGLVKNAIDLLDDLREDARPYFDGRPVGLIVTAAGWQAGGVTLGALRSIVHAMRGWPTPAGLTVNAAVQRPFDESGALIDPEIETKVRLLASQLMQPAGMSGAGE